MKPTDANCFEEKNFEFLNIGKELKKNNLMVATNFTLQNHFLEGVGGGEGKFFISRLKFFETVGEKAGLPNGLFKNLSLGTFWRALE
jgi:hypothetical protein